MRYQIKTAEEKYYGPFESQEKASAWAANYCKLPWTMLILIHPSGIPRNLTDADYVELLGNVG